MNHRERSTSFLPKFAADRSMLLSLSLSSAMRCLGLVSTTRKIWNGSSAYARYVLLCSLTSFVLSSNTYVLAQWERTYKCEKRSFKERGGRRLIPWASISACRCLPPMTTVAWSPSIFFMLVFLTMKRSLVSRKNSRYDCGIATAGDEGVNRFRWVCKRRDLVTDDTIRRSKEI